MEIKTQKNEVIKLFNREKLELDNVIEVLSSTDKAIVAKLDNDYIEVVGTNLKVVKLLPEEKFMIAKGNITSINFVSKFTKKSFFNKVFK